MKKSLIFTKKIGKKSFDFKISIKDEYDNKIDWKDEKAKIGGKYYYVLPRIIPVSKNRKKGIDYRKKNPEKIKKLNTEWQKKNRKKLNEKARKRLADLKKNNPSKYQKYLKKRRISKKNRQKQRQVGK
ncbi:MAG: hypothetical protein GWN01_01915 [Nitrosopumilaceae archaeon]|nr:hypothetical protein [Nitrosopumilaceae archaeon]NIT99729.1 hypothetical protein [Nitrosopumilaceae archaeon]NIV64865.1 hypothetical protein [Nitrosopumilaceae archaeon]NIX60332.1 hypothetical protein [Nitrosopumilaceae archaeon]